MAKINLPECWPRVAEPLRADGRGRARGAHGWLGTADIAAVSARVWDAIRASVRARIADAQAAQPLKR
jgi:hypothetical protein